MPSRPECLQLVAGCLTNLIFTVLDEDGDPFSLTGNRVRFGMKRNHDDAAAQLVVSKDSNDGPSEIEILLSPDDNKARVKILAADTQALEEGMFCAQILVDIVATGECVQAYFNYVNVVDNAFVP